jgi:hypothetical protein
VRRPTTTERFHNQAGEVHGKPHCRGCRAFIAQQVARLAEADAGDLQELLEDLLDDACPTLPVPPTVSTAVPHQTLKDVLVACWRITGHGTR